MKLYLELLKKAQILYDIKKYSQAEVMLREAMAIQPNDIRPRLLFGYTLYKLNRMDEAFDLSESLISNQPMKEEVLNFRIYTLINFKKYLEAQKLIKDALNINPVEAAFWYYQAVVSYKLGRYQNCIDAAQKSLELEVNDTDTLNYMALALSALSKTANAESVVQHSLHLNPNQAGTFETAGLVEYFRPHELDRDLQKSKRMFEEALAINPVSEVAQLGLKMVNKNINESNLWPWLGIIITLSITCMLVFLLPDKETIEKIATIICIAICTQCSLILWIRFKRKRKWKATSD